MRKSILIPAIVLLLNVNLSAQNDSIWTLEKCINYALNRNIQVRKSELGHTRSANTE